MRLDCTGHRVEAGNGLGLATFGFMREKRFAIGCRGNIEAVPNARAAMLASDVAVIAVLPDPQGRGPGGAVPARSRGLRHALSDLRQPHRRGAGPAARHRGGAPGLSRPRDPAAPDPGPRGRSHRRRARPDLRARLAFSRGRPLRPGRDPRKCGGARGARSSWSTCPYSTTLCWKRSSRTVRRPLARSTRSAPACSVRTASRPPSPAPR